MACKCVPSAATVYLALRNWLYWVDRERAAESINLTVLYFQLCVQSATTNVAEFCLPVLYSADWELFPLPWPKYPTHIKKGAFWHDYHLNHFTSKVSLRVKKPAFEDWHVYRIQTTFSLAGFYSIIFHLMNNLKQFFFFLEFVMQTWIFQMCDKNVWFSDWSFSNLTFWRIFLSSSLQNFYLILTFSVHQLALLLFKEIRLNWSTWLNSRLWRNSAAGSIFVPLA